MIRTTTAETCRRSIPVVLRTRRPAASAVPRMPSSSAALLRGSRADRLVERSGDPSGPDVDPSLEPQLTSGQPRLRIGPAYDPATTRVSCAACTSFRVLPDAGKRICAPSCARRIPMVLACADALSLIHAARRGLRFGGAPIPKIALPVQSIERTRRTQSHARIADGVADEPNLHASFRLAAIYRHFLRKGRPMSVVVAVRARPTAVRNRGFSSSRIFRRLDSRLTAARHGARSVRAAASTTTSKRRLHGSRHPTFFEMLGNFSFGYYFKRDAIATVGAATASTSCRRQTLATVYFEDDEAFDIWTRKSTFRPDRCIRIGDNRARARIDNFFQMADTVRSARASRSSTTTACCCASPPGTPRPTAPRTSNGESGVHAVRSPGQRRQRRCQAVRRHRNGHGTSGACCSRPFDFTRLTVPKPDRRAARETQTHRPANPSLRVIADHSRLRLPVSTDHP